MFVAKVVIGLLLLAFSTFGALNAESLDQQECPQICPDNYDPVCATDGKTFEEFANQCEFNTKNCLSQKASLKPSVATALDMCRTEFVGSLDKLLTKLGDIDLTKSGCLKPCAMIYKPVCISNGKLRFQASNECIMNTINCAMANNDSFKVLRNGSC